MSDRYAAPNRPIRLGEVPVLRVLRAHLTAAADARRTGDYSSADAAEVAAIVALRTALSPLRQAKASP